MRTTKPAMAIAILLTALLILLTPSMLLAAREPLGHKPDELIVRFKPGAPAEEIVKAHGATSLKQISRLDMHCLRLPPGLSVDKAVERFRKNPNVISARPNRILKAALMPNDDWFMWFQWGLYNTPSRADVKAPEAWNISTGSPNTIIAIVDTGIDATHPDLTGRVIAGYNAIDGSTNTHDDHMHGTFVAAVAGANSNNYEGIAGMDWHARLMPIKVLSGSGYGDEFDAADGVIWAADNGAKIINLSLGAYEDETNAAGLAALEVACNYAWDQGCLVVCAAGNDYLDDAVERHYPSYYPVTLSVGGTDDTDAPWLEYDIWTGELVGGTNYGDSLDVMAPSYFVLSAVPMWYLDDVGTLLGEPYEFGSGTSAAAPLVSGLAGLIWAEHPNWTNQQVRDQIKNTCDDLEAPGWDRYTGWGRINAFRALNEAAEVYPSIASLRNAPIGSRVSLDSKLVSAGTTDFGDRFYIQESNRSSGIMVYYGPNVVTPTSESQLVTLSGKLAYIDGQLAITEPQVSVSGSADPPIPMGVSNKSLGGEYSAFGGVTGGNGLVNTGLLLTTWGRVTASGWNYFYIDDGSRLLDGSGFRGLKVFTGSLSRPAVGQFVIVKGISTIETPQGTPLKIPVIRPRRGSDIIVGG